ncbi:MAG: N-acetyltransferase [Chitinophagales bacterium]|nr:N-acetyltransferase [Chitinophagales bacterium]
MNVQHEGNDKKARFFLEENGKRIALMDYVYAGTDKFIIQHTEVDSAYEGRGLGKILVDAAVEMAREKGLSIIPLCPFANALFRKRREEYQDVTYRQ